MKQKATTEVQKYIEYNKLFRTDGVYLFDAEVTCSQNTEVSIIQSKVQILVLPNSDALYIYEFFNPVFELSELYDTTDSKIVCKEDGSLLIQPLLVKGLSLNLKMVPL